MSELEQLFKGLADQTRIRILNLLIHGELCVCGIQHVLAATQPTVSRHLTYLKNSNLVLDRREGTRIYYRIAHPAEGIHKPLFDFLQDAFKSSEVLAEDARKLEKAIESGSFAASEWRRYPASRQSEAAHSPGA